MFTICQGVSNKMFEYEKVISNLKKELGLKNNTQLANILGVSTQTMGNWKIRSKIPYKEIHTVCLNKNLDLNYILNDIKKEEIEKKIDYEKEIIENIKKLNEKEKIYIYHLIESKIIKKEI